MSTTHNKKSNKPFVDSLDLPSSYNRTNLTLISRDPHWIYAYWEIAHSSFEDFKRQAGAEWERAVRVLRMYDVTYINFDGFNAHRQFDIDIGHNANNWYVNLWGDNAGYCADLGMRLPDGRFYKFARSNAVSTPRANPSGRTDEIWMKAEQGREGRPYVYGEIQRNNAAQQRRPAHTGNSYLRQRRISLNEDDVRRYYSNLSPLLKDIISARLSRQLAGARRKPGDINVILRNSGKGSHLAGRYSKKMMLGASEETLMQGASESAPGASENSIPGKKFFFELNTELIVYGRTEPDAKVLRDGKFVPLRPDGTFSMRFMLPDGRIPLPFKAIAADGEQTREISTAVNREKTKYA